MIWWNWYCFDCKWKGTPPDLIEPEGENDWQCPKCRSENIEDLDWHKEEE